MNASFKSDKLVTKTISRSQPFSSVDTSTKKSSARSKTLNQKNKSKNQKRAAPSSQNVPRNKISNEQQGKIDNKNLNEMVITNLSNTTSSTSTSLLEQETDVDNETQPSEANHESASLLGASSSSHHDITSRSNEIAAKNDLKSTTFDRRDSLPSGWEQHSDKTGLYYWHVSTGTIQRTRPTKELSPKKNSIVYYLDDEEINQPNKTSSSDDDYYDSGAALTVDDTNDCTFIVYPLGCCEFDETQLASTASNKAIQKCILRLTNKPTKEESTCWGLDQTQPVLMRLFDDYIQFTDVRTRTLLRSQPIQTIRTWAVDDDNNFAFVIEDLAQHSPDYYDTLDQALLDEPVLMCYVLRSMDDDDMAYKVAAKLNEEINRYKESMNDRITKSTRIQQMIEQQPGDDQTDAEDFEEISNSEMTMNVKYIGKTTVSRPTGIDVLNVAIDKCLAESAKNQINRSVLEVDAEHDEQRPLLIEAKLHVSPSSVIIENTSTGEIIVECRIRYLTFMGISKRDIRWCGFIMQNAASKTFVAHSFECHPTAGYVCEAIQLSCVRMYEKVVKNTRQPETVSIIPTGSKIRNTIAKTFSRIKLNPIL